MQDKKSKVAQELAAHKEQMRGGGLALSQGTRRILQERQRHTLKASQAAAAMTASGLLNQVTTRQHLSPACFILVCCALRCCPLCRAVLCCGLCVAVLKAVWGVLSSAVLCCHRSCVFCLPC